MHRTVEHPYPSHPTTIARSSERAVAPAPTESAGLLARGPSHSAAANERRGVSEVGISSVTELVVALLFEGPPSPHSAWVRSVGPYSLACPVLLGVKSGGDVMIEVVAGFRSERLPIPTLHGRTLR